MANGKVYVANVNPGHVRQEFMLSIIQIILYGVGADEHGVPNGERVGHFAPRLAGPLLSVYRNYCVQHWLDETEDEYCFFADSDVVFPSSVLHDLTDSCTPKTPVISGVYYCVLNEGIRPSAWHIEDTTIGEVTGPHLVPYEKHELTDGLMAVDAVGAGCLMLHRDFMQLMRQRYESPEPWFKQEVYGGILYGEDFTLCARTREMGYPVLLDTSVKCGHLKTYNLDENFMENLDLSPSVQLGEVV